MDTTALRAHFPILQREIGGRPIVYLDSACMALKPDAVIDAVASYYRECPACGGVGRSDHALGREVDRRVFAAREAVRRFLNAKPCTDDYGPRTPTKEIVFTRNATEAINLVARCFPFAPGAVVLTTDREHSSNLCPWKELEARGTIRHRWVPSRPDETFDLEAYEAILRAEQVELVSMVHVSNLDGSAIPAREVVALAHRHGARVLLDAAQSAPHLPIDVQALDVDFLALSLHKLCGPTGVGVLYGKEELLDGPSFGRFQVGGDTVVDAWLDRPPLYHDSPFRFEAGLQDYAGIVGTAAAIEFVESLGREAIREHVRELNRHLSEGLRRYSGEVEILGPQDPALRHGIATLCFRRRGIVSLFDEDVTGAGNILDHWANIMVRTGEFCVHSWFHQRRLGRERERLRVSFHAYNTIEECDLFLEILGRLLARDEYRMLQKLA